MQERLEKIVIGVRWGVLGAIGIGTLAAALFSGCSADFSNKNDVKPSDEKKKIEEEVYREPRLVKYDKKNEQSEKADSVYEETGPVLFDPRVNMGLPSSESVYEELSRQDADKERSQFPIISGYQGQLQPLQAIQTPRTESYQSTDQSYQQRTVPRTDNNLDSSQSRVISPSYQNTQRAEDTGRKEY